MTSGVHQNSELFDGKRVLVTGGTGSLGKALVRRLLSGEIGDPTRVTVFSRDEGKQHDMRMALRDRCNVSDGFIRRDYGEVLRFAIGDVRSFDSVAQAVRGADVIFHAAALKQVPSCEYFPGEAVATNILGPENITRAIERLGAPVEAVVGLSTDKACKPVNVMGMTKAVQERLLINANLHCPETRFVCARYGNVLASRGSVIPVFHGQIKAGGPVTLTMPGMTRFLLSQGQAIDTIIEAYRVGKRGEVFVPRVPSSHIKTLAECLIGDRGIDMVEIGSRPGEKVHEILVAEDEVGRTVERDGYYVIGPGLPELVSMEVVEPALQGEFGSDQVVMPVEQTLTMLRENGLLIEDEPDFANLFG